MHTLSLLFLMILDSMCGRQVKAMTKLPNSEQSSKGKVKKYINRQNQSTTGKLWKP